MKKAVLSSILILSLCASLCSCSSTSTQPVNSTAENTTTQTANDTTEETSEETEPFPYVGTWATEDHKAYLKIYEDHTLVMTAMLESNITTTVNGVSTNKVTTSINTYDFTWDATDDIFYFNGTAEYTPAEKDGQYMLTYKSTTYYRVGDLDYEIQFEEPDQGDGKIDLSLCEQYVLGTTIKAEGFELTLDEVGLAEDIRITTEGDLTITAGPSVIEGKQYVYLKGTLKNTGTTSMTSAIGGKVYLDEYEFDLKTDLISTQGAPTAHVDPLDTARVILYVEISDEMASVFSSGKIIFGFNDNFADVLLEKAQYLYYVDVPK